MMKRRYFGYYPVLNIVASKLLFWTINRRRKSLLRRNKKKNKVGFILKNDGQTSSVFKEYLNQGFRKLNIGGGGKNLHGFLNIDFIKHENVEHEVVANVLDLSFIPDACIDQVHSNHLVEHLTIEQFKNQLSQYSRILVTEGKITIRCPNALGVSYGFFFGQVKEKDHSTFIELGFPKDEDFYNPLDGWYHQDVYGFYHWIYADTGNIENEHLTQFTPSLISELIQEGGFEILKITAPETSNISLVAKKKSL